MTNFKSYTTDEVAAFMRTTPVTVRKMIRTGELGAFKVGTRGPKAQWRVTEAELMRFMGVPTHGTGAAS